MNVNTVTRLLPYLLLAFIGAAGWSMESIALLAVVVLGTMGVAIGTTMASRPPISHMPEGASARVQKAFEENNTENV